MFLNHLHTSPANRSPQSLISSCCCLVLLLLLPPCSTLSWQILYNISQQQQWSELQRFLLPKLTQLRAVCRNPAAHAQGSGNSRRCYSVISLRFRHCWYQFGFQLGSRGLILVDVLGLGMGCVKGQLRRIQVICVLLDSSCVTSPRTIT